MLMYCVHNAPNPSHASSSDPPYAALAALEDLVEELGGRELNNGAV